MIARSYLIISYAYNYPPVILQSHTLNTYYIYDSTKVSTHTQGPTEHRRWHTQAPYHSTDVLINIWHWDRGARHACCLCLGLQCLHPVSIIISAHILVQAYFFTWSSPMCVRTSPYQSVLRNRCPVLEGFGISCPAGL